jgi:hypothetical protein
MDVRLECAYEPPAAPDGYGVLIDGSGRLASASATRPVGAGARAGQRASPLVRP